ARAADLVASGGAAATTDTADAGVAAPGAAQVGFASASYQVAAGEPAARIVVRRLGSGNADASFIWWTEAASAQPDVDYAELGQRIETIPAGTDKITVYVPIISNPQRARPSQFYVALGDADSSGATPAGARATVTIDRDN
ncbi:MAG TPA: hypothetical protein VII41_08690, partial [Steroidobacteraceae bacterium]